MKIKTRKQKVIVDDSQTKANDLYDGRLYPIGVSQDIDVREDKISIFQWLRKIEQNQLDLNPDFQRKPVWTITQQSEFIESVILNIPLPPMYVYQKKDGIIVIVDGLQRTISLKKFVVDKDLTLKSLKVLTELNGKVFNDLAMSIKTKIEDKNLLVYILKPSINISVVHDIFNRINTRGSQLTRQEVRNCIYRGNSTELLRELSEKEYFKQSIDYGISDKRMKDREAILRCLAFQLFNFATYNSNMDEFLGNTMDRINSMKQNEINDIINKFETAIKLTYIIFHKNNFRLVSKKNKRGPVNIALMEVVYNYFVNADINKLNNNKEKLVSGFKKLIRDVDFLDAVKSSTGDKNRVNTRFKKVDEYWG